MSRALVLAAAVGVALGAGLAVAAPPPPSIKPPAGWRHTGAEPEIAAVARAATELRGATAVATVDGYRPSAPGGSLHVTRLEIRVDAARRDALARAELDELREVARRHGAGAAIEVSTQRVDPAAKQLEAVLAWRDDAAGLVAVGRTLIAADAAGMYVVTGQCNLALDAPQLRRACEAALLTLDPGVPAATRVALALVEPIAEPPAEAPVEPSVEPPAEPPPTSEKPRIPGEQPRLGEGAPGPHPPIRTPPRGSAAAARPTAGPCTSAPGWSRSRRSSCGTAGAGDLR